MTTQFPEPAFVRAILRSQAILFAARLLLASAYLLGGITKLLDYQGAIAEQAHFGLTQPALWAAMTIAVEVAGSLMVLFDRLTWLGAGMLGVFTILAAFVANDFWTMQGAERFAATNAFFEHLGLAGAFVLVAALSLANRNGPASRDRSKTG